MILRRKAVGVLGAFPEILVTYFCSSLALGFEAVQVWLNKDVCISSFNIFF